MAERVEIVMSVENRNLLNAFQKQQGEILKNQRALLKMGDAGRKSGADMGAGVRGAIGSLARLAAGYFGVQTAIRAMSEEFQKYRDLQDKAAEEQMTFGDAVREARKMFVADETVENIELEGLLEGIATRTGADPRAVARAAGAALSAKGSATNIEVLGEGGFLDTAFRFSRDEEEAKTLASRALDIRKATGITDPRKTIGFALSMTQAARVENIEAVGKHLVPAVGNLTKLGDSAEQAGELLVTLNSLMGDAEGSLSKTAGISFGVQLREFAEESQTDKGRKKLGVSEAQAAALAAAGSTTERLEVLQADKALQDAFLRRASFEKAATVPIEQLVRGEDTAMREFEAVRKVVLPPDEAGKVFEQKVKDLEAGEFSGGRRLTEQATAAITEFELANVGGRRAADARKVLEQTLDAIDLKGFDLVEKKAVMGGFEGRMKLGISPEEAAAGALRREAKASTLFTVGSKERDLLEKQAQLLEQTGAREDQRQMQLQSIEDRRRQRGAPTPTPEQPTSTSQAALPPSGFGFGNGTAALDAIERQTKVIERINRPAPTHRTPAAAGTGRRHN